MFFRNIMTVWKDLLTGLHDYHRLFWKTGHSYSTLFFCQKWGINMNSVLKNMGANSSLRKQPSNLHQYYSVKSEFIFNKSTGSWVAHIYLVQILKTSTSFPWLYDCTAVCPGKLRRCHDIETVDRRLTNK